MGIFSATSTQSTSRRALLAGGLGGLGAWAAGAVGRASPVRAEGETMVVGGDYFNATTVTQLVNVSTDQPVFHAQTGGAGTALAGFSTNGYGVLGYGENAYGVAGSTTVGVGVNGSAYPTGVALQAQGRIKFTTSGVATIPAGSTSKTISPGVNVTLGSFVLLTPKANLGSRALWFTTNATANTFRINMSSTRSRGTRIAWLLVG